MMGGEAKHYDCRHDDFLALYIALRQMQYQLLLSALTHLIPPRAASHMRREERSIQSRSPRVCFDE